MSKFLLLAGLTLGLAGCARGRGPDELAGLYVEDLVAGQRWERWDSIMAPDARINGNALARPFAEGTTDGLHRAFPDLAIDVREQLVDGDAAVVTFVIRGTHDGHFGLLAATGRSVTMSGVVIVRERDGRISELTQLIDYWQAVEQITAPGPREG